MKVTPCPGDSRSLRRSGARNRYVLPDLSVGNAADDDPLETYSWQDLREIIYKSQGG